MYEQRDFYCPCVFTSQPLPSPGLRPRSSGSGMRPKSSYRSQYSASHAVTRGESVYVRVPRGPCHSAVPIPYRVTVLLRYYYARSRPPARPHLPYGAVYLVPYACSSGPVTRLERNAGDDTSRYRARPGLPPTNAHCAAARACGSTFHVRRNRRYGLATVRCVLTPMCVSVCVSAPPGVFQPDPPTRPRPPTQRFFATGTVSRVSRVCPGSPRCLFTGTVPVRNTCERRAARDARGRRDTSSGRGCRAWFSTR